MPNPYLKPKKLEIQRADELREIQELRTAKKKKALDPVKRKKKVQEFDDPVFDEFEDLETPKKKKKKKKKVVPDLPITLSETEDDWGIAEHKEKEKPKITKMTRKNVKSILATDRERILQLIERDEMDTATTAIYKRMLQALVDVVGHSEAMIHKSKGQRGTHQLNLLVGSIRDVLLDLQQAQDRGQLGNNLVHRYIAPAFLQIGTEYLRQNQQLYQWLSRELEPELLSKFKEKLDQQEPKFGEFVQSQYRSVVIDVQKFLQR